MISVLSEWGGRQAETKHLFGSLKKMPNSLIIAHCKLIYKTKRCLFRKKTKMLRSLWDLNKQLRIGLAFFM